MTISIFKTKAIKYCSILNMMQGSKGRAFGHFYNSFDQYLSPDVVHRYGSYNRLTMEHQLAASLNVGLMRKAEERSTEKYYSND